MHRSCRSGRSARTTWARSSVVAAAVASLSLMAACTSGSVDKAAAASTSSSATASSATGTFGANGADVTATTGTAGATAVADRALDTALAELVAMPGGPPGAIAVVQRGSAPPATHAAGVSVIGGGLPTANDHMRIASAAKAFSGATALALVQQGRMKLTDTIGTYLPELPKAWSAVTLKQLLSHTSGVPDFSQVPAFAAAVKASLTKAPAPEQLLSFAEKQPLDFPAGSAYVYSNSDNVIVALMVAKATNGTYEAALTKEVLTPLGLTQTSLPSGIAMPGPYLHGYDLDPPAAPEDVSLLLAGGWAWASGGIVSTPADMNTFIRGYVGGKLFSGSVLAQQHTYLIPGGGSEPPGPGDNSAGMALFRYQTPCGTVYGHTGNTLGYTQFIAASADGTDSVTTSITLQRTAKSTGQEALVFTALQRAEAAAVCAALAR